MARKTSTPPGPQDDRRSAHEIRRGLRPAPGDLALVQAFANSVGGGRDELESPRALADWLAARGLLPPGIELTEADARRARRARDGLRAVIAARRLRHQRPRRLVERS